MLSGVAGSGLNPFGTELGDCGMICCVGILGRPVLSTVEESTGLLYDLLGFYAGTQL